MPKLFPILNAKGLIRYIPWELVEPHRAQAHKNHGQTLEGLAKRGGLDWAELFAVMNGLDWQTLTGVQPATAKAAHRLHGQHRNA
jgi:hypothetical protein